MSDIITVTVEDIVTVTELPTQDIIYINDASVPGPKGDTGESPSVSSYNRAKLNPVAGILTLDASLATTFFITLDSNVSAVTILNMPVSTKTERIAMYFKQDANGSHNVLGWPAGIKWNNGNQPVLTTTPNAVDCVVLDIVPDGFDPGVTIYGTMVGYNYS